MPPVDPSIIKRSVPAGGQQAPIVWTNPRQERATEQSIANGQNTIAVEAERLRLAQQANEREARRQEQQQHDRELSGGFESKSEQDRAAFHASNILRKSLIIRNTLARHPDAIGPGLAEAVAGTVGEAPRRLVTKDTGRQSLVNAYRSIVESLIYLDTGAAASEEQIRNLTGEIVPAYGDDQDALINKALSLQGRLDDAKMWSGPAGQRVGVPLAPAIKDNLTQNLDVRTIYALPPTINLDDYNGKTPEQKQLSTETKQIPIPPEMQKDYREAIAAKGGLQNFTPEEYADLRTRLDQKYFVNAEAMSPETAKEFLESRKSIPNADPGNIPPIEAPLSKGVLNGGDFTTGGLIGDKGAAVISSSGPGVAGMNAANAGLLGFPEKFNKEAFDMTREVHPNWAVAGDMAGAVMPITAAESGAGALARKLGGAAGMGTELAANAGYGAVRGANSAEDGQALTQAGIGALTGGAGALGGRFLTKGSGGFVSPQTQAALDQLREIGADPTTLQRAGLGKFEETFRSLPFVRGALDKAEHSVIRGNTEQALRHLDGVSEILAKNTPEGVGPAPELPTTLPKHLETGFETNTLLKDTFSGEGGAYDSLWKRVGGAPTKGFAEGISALKLEASISPGIAKAFREDLQPLVVGLLNKTGTYDGTTVQDTLLQLGKLKRDYLAMADAATNGKPSDNRAIAAMADKLSKQIKSMVSENQPDLGTALTKIDTGYRQMKTVFDASVRGRATEGVPSLGQTLSSVVKKDGSVDHDAVATNQAFGQKPITAATRVMGSKSVPETVSPWQTGTALGIGGISAVKAPAVLPIAAALGTALYTPGVKRITQALLSHDVPEAVMKHIPPQVQKVVSSLLADPKTQAAISDYVRQKLEGQ